MIRFIGLIILSFAPFTLSYNILALFLVPSYSHQLVFNSVTEKLAQQGHNVTVVTPVPSDDPALNVIDFTMHRKLWWEVESYSISNLDPAKFVSFATSKQAEMVENIMRHPRVQLLLNKENQKFDAVITEWMGIGPFTAFSRLYEVPLIAIASLDLLPLEHAVLGNVVHPILHPENNVPFHGKMSFWERLQSVVLDLTVSKRMFSLLQPQLDRITEKYFGNIGTSEEMMRDVDLAIVTAHPALGNIRPVTPKTLPIGFLHIRKPDNLSERVLDVLKKPTVYMSLGSGMLTSKLDPRIMRIFKDVFRELTDFNIIFKWEGEGNFEDIPNVFEMQWAPQQDILANKNVSLFVTHGGQQSVEEAVDRGVPMLVVPFMNDQIASGKRMASLGIAKCLELENLNQKTFKEGILEVHGNPRYREKILKLREIVRDAPMPPLDTAIWWIEYVIRHKGMDHFNYRGAEVPFWEYYLLDVILFTAVLLGFLCLLAFLALRRLLGRKKEQKKQNKKRN